MDMVGDTRCRARIYGPAGTRQPHNWSNQNRPRDVPASSHWLSFLTRLHRQFPKGRGVGMGNGVAEGPSRTASGVSQKQIYDLLIWFEIEHD